MDWQSEALEPLRRQMVQFATLQLDDAAAAEDAVQEAIAAAMRHAASFAGRSALKTWVFAILKNKIRDELRRRARLVPFSGSGGRDEEEEPLTELFDRRGHWLPDSRPQAWGDPEAVENDRQFWAVFHLCLERLPPKQAQVFMMREMLELTTPEICRNLELTENHVNVLLYRARMRLCVCLEERWFERDHE